tara:strand:- start:6562 stop:7212 length:651 start_codon:yes stop_codon:yes gene_type:complete
MDKLPQVDMSEVEDARAQVEAEQQRVNMVIEEELEEVMPEVKPRVTIEDSDIFGGMDKPLDLEKPVKKKRVMSEQQKENLKKGREKALAIRRAKAQEKKDIAELESKVKKKKKQDLVDFLGESEPTSILKIKPIAPEPSPAPPVPPPTQSYDFETALEKGIKSALEKHDSERKVRKQKKMVDQKKANESSKLKNMVMSAQRDPKYYGQSGYFDNCF